MTEAGYVLESTRSVFLPRAPRFSRAFAGSGTSDWLRWVDATFSTYKDDSEISRINRGELGRKNAHPHVRAVLERCDHLCNETGGYFDMQTPSATAAFAMGPELAPHWTARLEGYEAMTILADETVFKTGGFPDE
jgi:thiamine biosynthesis lipoprotein ApbE